MEDIKITATALGKLLRSMYDNIQVVGIRCNNKEAYDKNPSLFVSRITEDSLVVYTTTKPLVKQLALVEYDGYKVSWKKSGHAKLISEQNWLCCL